MRSSSQDVRVHALQERPHLLLVLCPHLSACVQNVCMCMNVSLHAGTNQRMHVHIPFLGMHAGKDLRIYAPMYTCVHASDEDNQCMHECICPHQCICLPMSVHPILSVHLLYIHNIYIYNYPSMRLSAFVRAPTYPRIPGCILYSLRVSTFPE